jgi:hypothetical protein
VAGDAQAKTTSRLFASNYLKDKNLRNTAKITASLPFLKILYSLRLPQNIE